MLFCRASIAIKRAMGGRERQSNITAIAVSDAEAESVKTVADAVSLVAAKTS